MTTARIDARFAALKADGFDALMGLLYAVSAVALAVAVIAFRRRDVAV